MTMIDDTGQKAVPHASSAIAGGHLEAARLVPGPAGTEGLSLASYATRRAYPSRLTSLRPDHVVPVGPSRSRGCGEPLGKRQYRGGPYATPHPSPSMDKANLARAPVRRATLRAAHAAPHDRRMRRSQGVAS
jgi:hypothetical protein